MNPIMSAALAIDEKDARIAELEAVVSCLLVSYEASFGNVSDALARRAAALVPDWRERADNFDPTKP